MAAMEARRRIIIEADDTDARELVMALEASAERLGEKEDPSEHDEAVRARRTRLAGVIDDARMGPRRWERT
jgi:hypothetical protein